MLKQTGFEFQILSDHGLRPSNKTVEYLTKRAVKRVLSKNTRAQLCYKEMNSSLKSRFNPYDLYVDLLPLTCRANGGNVNDKNGFYNGLKLILSSSIENQQDIICVKEIDGIYHVHLGDLINDSPTGFLLNTRDKYEWKMVEKHIAKALKDREFEVRIEQITTSESRLYAHCKTHQPLIKADQIAKILLSRLGMEASAANLARVQNNAEMINDKNYTDFLRVKGNEREYYPDTILMGEIRHCRRCLSIWPDIVELTKHYPSIQFGILVLEKPMWDLKKRLFDKDAVLARNRGLVVPMFLFYKSGEFKEIIATKREEHPPAINSILQSIAKHFSISDA